MQKISPAYTVVLELYNKAAEESRKTKMYSHNLENRNYSRDDTGATTYRIPNPVFIYDTMLFGRCNIQEWYLVGRIATELKDYNVLWSCDDKIKRNGTTQKALRGLIDKKVIFKTETASIYIVNPFFIRKGDPLPALSTTLNMLEREPKVEERHYTNKKAVKNYKPGRLEASMNILPYRTAIENTEDITEDIEYIE